MVIYNQDMDRQHTYRPGIDRIQMIAVYHEDVYMGTNLMLGNNLLGTVDSYQEAVNERDIIRHWPYEIYVVAGGVYWREYRTLCEIIGGE